MTGWPVELALTQEMRDYANQQSVEPESEFEAWKDDCAAHNRKYADWSAAWRTRIRNAVKWRKPAIGFVQSKPTAQSCPQSRREDWDEYERECMMQTPEQRRANLKKLEAIIASIK